MSTYLSRLAAFTETLLLNRSPSEVPTRTTVDFERLRRQCFEGGVPDEPGYRALSWKLLLNYLPSNKARWEETLRAKRRAYRGFVDDLFGTELDKTQLAEIAQDVHRTSFRMGFFQQPVSEKVFEAAELKRPEFGSGRHCDVIQRILYIYAKLNAGVGYIQGMNHLAFPIYYLLAGGTGELTEDQIYAESDTFYLFHEVITDYRDYFMHSMDNNKNSGIRAAMSSIGTRIAKVDPQLSRWMEDNNIVPEYYAFRWCTCLFSQDLEMPDVLRLWDTLFADRMSARKRARREYIENTGAFAERVSSESPRERFSPLAELYDPDGDTALRPGKFVIDLSCAYVMSHRSRLLKCQFDESLELLQSYPWTGFESVLQQAYRDHYKLEEPRAKSPSFWKRIGGDG